MAVLLQDGTSLLLQDGTELQAQASADPYYADVITLLQGGAPNLTNELYDGALSPLTPVSTNVKPFYSNLTTIAGATTSLGKFYKNGAVIEYATYPLNDGDWFMECRYNQTSATPAAQYVMHNNNAAVSGWPWIVHVGSNIVFWANGSNQIAIAYTEGTEVHLAVRYIKLAGTLEFFLDGVLQATYTNGAAMKDTLRIGNANTNGSTTSAANGYIDGFRFTASDRLAGASSFTPDTLPLYTEVPAPTPPTEDALYDDVVVLLNGGPTSGTTTLVDSAPVPLTYPTVTGTPTYTDTYTAGGGTSITSWGLVEWDNTEFDLNQDWTQEVVCYDTNPGGYLWSNRGGDGGLEFVIITGNYITLWVGGSNRVNVPMGDGYAYHVAVTYEASTGTLRIFVDGIYKGQYVNGAALENNMYLGGYSAGGGNWTGEIESFRWTHGIRYPGTADFSPPAHPLPTSAPPAVDPLAILTEPVSASVVEGAVAQFSVVGTGGTGPYTYQWYNAVGDVALVEGVTGDNVTTDTVSVTTTLGDDGNTYYVIITDSA